MKIGVCTTLAVASALLLSTAAGAQTTTIGDLFAGTCDSVPSNTQLNEVDVFTPLGALVTTFRGPQQNSCLTGMTFDAAGNLHVISDLFGTTNWGVMLFDGAGNLITTSPLYNSPTSILHDQQGNFYLGNGSIIRVDGVGNATTLSVAGGVQYVTLTPDQQTLVYSAANGDVKSFSLATLTQGPDYAIGTGATMVRMLPDNSLLIDSNGAVEHWTSRCAGCYPYRRTLAYQLPANATSFTLDPDGATFWGVNAYYDSVNQQGHADISRANIKTGAVTTTFSLPLLTNGRSYSGSIAIAGDGANTSATLPSSLTFAAQSLGSASPSKGATLTNTGAVEMVTSNFTISGDFAIKTNSCAKGVLPGAHCSLGIVFTPTQTGTRTGTLSVYGNTATRPLTVALSGIGVAGTSVELSSSLNPSTFGQTVTLTSQVSNGTGNQPTGTVVFLNGTKALGTVTLSGGIAALTTATLPAGTLPLTVKYNGDAGNAKGTSAPVSQVVNQATTATSLTSSPNPSIHGRQVKFIATVTSATVIPTGQVTFTAGATTLGKANVVNGTATLNYTGLPVGNTTVTATYGGTASIVGSSASVIQIVN